jgi:hypothetical protein
VCGRYAGFILRFIGSIALPAVIKPPVAKMIADPAYTYGTVLRIHRTNTYKLLAIGALLPAAALLFLRWRRC